MFNRKNHWEGIYQDKDSHEVSWYQKNPLLSLELIRHSQINSDDAIIDVGGGASELVDYLYGLGFRNLAVLDISQNALLSSQRRLGKTALEIEWYESDITEFNAPHLFSLWHDRAVFHFLTDKSDRQKYINILKQTLKSGGVLILAAFEVGGPDKCSGLDVVQYDVEKISAELGGDFKLLDVRSENHITPSSVEQKFMYFHFSYLP
ncbi:MAG: SAM-dependent methyltransferase [endosymbiont of Galathealinum brachiosum]|uniref:SAM-dependent methyltransferase n=1 Tax=endosymbiont of Galathealinum brachiosum TaxID=2200906 RepID=A0A370D6T7_9GAMM|nr:MAG: SAM-dependent methyltransferase [endosymbiont of Galathealinum brachiosum]